MSYALKTRHLAAHRQAVDKKAAARKPYYRLHPELPSLLLITAVILAFVILMLLLTSR